MRAAFVASSSPARCAFQTSRSVLVTPASAASRNSTACAFGSRLSVSSGSVPIAFRPGVSRMTSPCCSSGCGKLIIGVPPARNVDAAFVAALERRQDVVVALVKRPYLRASATGTRLTCDTRASASRHPVRRGEVERERHPLVGVVLEFGDRRLVEPRFDRQQPDRRRPRRVVQELGRAHRRAARRRRQQPLAEVGEEDRVDQLRLAARELGDERDDELVLLQALEQLLDLDVDLRIGEVLLLQPFVQRRDAGRQPAPPIGVGFEARGEVA